MLKNERILVVEDDPQVAEILQWNLFAAGYQVTVVQDGLAALRSFDDERPALVTIDLNVPTVSGFRLVELFKRYAPSVPVLVVTALAFEEAEEIARAGADDFVTKPFDPYQLVRKIEYHLHHKASLQITEAPTSPPPPRITRPVEVA
ncbi:MAG TPA: response regulator [Chloroflexota bacterium]|nr:response regulator [Chloroflexota bacterium]